MNAQAKAIVDGTDAAELYKLDGNVTLRIVDGRLAAFIDNATGLATPVPDRGVGFVALVFDPLNELADHPAVSVGGLKLSA